ncbi:hypothetical protein Pla175_16470 [Pirellulimonas nuda]|uniref:Uncharacterized protein n=1 Tax=Pirellulimonas nuda TaxID=2528009 RepID=A0A518DA02_9BACT|nr:hypothetical protein [Pirellulimonas nuda]QDU88273.1 hypothetical protein Pla175_16470 [Pirellulimonas nuda]
MAAAVSRTDRRRRALQDSSAAASTSAPGEGQPASEQRSAASYDRPDQSLGFLAAQSLVPQNAWLLAACSTAGVAAAIGGVALLDRFAGSPVVSGIAALNLGSAQAATAWLESVLLLAAGGFALLVYRMRRRRTDDFRGCYRWWLAAVIGLPIAALCVGVGLHGDAARLAGARLGWTAETSRAVSLVAPLAAVLLPLALRLGWQMRSAPLAMTQLIGASAAYAVGLSAAFGFLPAAWSSVSLHAAPLVGAVLLIGCLAAFARRMVLEASGSVAQRAPRKPKQAAAKPEPSAKPAIKIAASTEPAEAAPVKPAPPQPTKKQPAASDESSKWVSGAEDGYRDDYEDGAENQGRLSKAERKRLRRAQADKRAA